MASLNVQQIAALVAKARLALGSSYEPSKGPIQSILPRQQRSRIDRGPSPSLWTSQVTLSAPPESDARDAVISAVKALGDEENSALDESSLQMSDIRAEWVAVKRNPKDVAREDSEKARYEALMGDIEEDSPTIIFVHGGAFFQNGFGTSRPTAAKLAKESGGRVIVLDYRLAPQSAFPSQILDLFVLYLSLLHPPSGALHVPVAASQIVLAGESCGANIVICFMQLLLHLQRQESLRTISFNSERVPIVSPAGVATVSLMGEQALTLPTWNSNRSKDIWAESAPFLEPSFPADDVWPSRPPRADIYCTGAQLSHPLVSPCLAERWEEAPTMWFAMGEECMWDSAALIAQRCASEGKGKLVWRAYEGMPHCWPFMLPKLAQSQDVLKRWGRACREIAQGPGQELGRAAAGTWITIDGQEKELDVRRLTRLTVEQAKILVRDKAKTRKVYRGNEKKNMLKL